MAEDHLEEHFKKVYASKLEQELDKIMIELEKLGLISKINILYKLPEVERYKIIKLKPYEE